MSYDEKVQKLLEVAGDYNTVTAGFNLEATLYTQMCKTARDKVKQAIEALSLGTIHLTIDANNYLTVCVDELNVSRSAFFDIFHLFAYVEKNAAETLKAAIDVLFVDALRLSISLHTCNTESIAKYISYARLILLGVNDTMAETVKEAISSYKEVEKDHQEKRSSYSDYVCKVSLALRLVSHAWFREKAVLVPGMKIGINNLKTYKTSIKTIKRCNTTDDHYSITFRESATVVTDPKRINEELTWYLNTKEHSDIAKAIKWSPIADFIE